MTLSDIDSNNGFVADGVSFTMVQAFFAISDGVVLVDETRHECAQGNPALGSNFAAAM